MKINFDDLKLVKYYDHKVRNSNDTCRLRRQSKAQIWPSRSLSATQTCQTLKQTGPLGNHDDFTGPLTHHQCCGSGSAGSVSFLWIRIKSWAGSVSNLTDQDPTETFENKKSVPTKNKNIIFYRPTGNWYRYLITISIIIYRKVIFQ